MDPSSSRVSYSPTSDTIISDLNDDCLLEVFQHLRDVNLAIVADVNARFRKISKEQFKRSKKTDIVSESVYFEKDSTVRLLHKHNAQVLRNFGALVESISMNGKHYNHRSESLELLSKYCSGTLSELSLYDFDITDEVALLLRPALASVQKLSLSNIEWGELFLEMLPSWCPELRDMTLSNLNKDMRYDRLDQEFPKLTRIMFDQVIHAKNSDVEAFLKMSPQLKEFATMNNSPGIDDYIFQLMAKYVPQIEHIMLFLPRRLQFDNINYIRQLSNLSRLQVYIGGESALNSINAMIEIINELVVAKIPIRILGLHSSGASEYHNMRDVGWLFVDRISKLEKLEELTISNLTGVSTSGIRTICENLKELSILRFWGRTFRWDREDLLHLIRVGHKLQELMIYTKDASRETRLCIDLEMVDEIVNILQHRDQTGHLKVILDKCDCILMVPKEILSKYEEVLELSVWKTTSY